MFAASLSCDLHGQAARQLGGDVRDSSSARAKAVNCRFPLLVVLIGGLVSTRDPRLTKLKIIATS